MESPNSQYEEMTEPSFAYLLKDGICRLKENDSLCDVTIVVEGKKFPCHKVVLASISKYFEAMFTSSMKESKSAEITMKDMEPLAFATILDFIYTGKCKISTENAQAIMYAADMLQIFALINICGEYIGRNLTPDNCLAIWQLAHAIQCKKLIQKSKHFCLQNFTKVPIPSVTSLSKEILIQYISSDDLNCQSEDNVAQIALQWIEAEPERETDAIVVLSHVRFSLLSSRYLMTLMDDEIIRCKEDILKLLHQAQHFQSDPTMYFELPYPKASPRHSLNRRECVLVIAEGDGFSDAPIRLAQPEWILAYEMPSYIRSAAVCSSPDNSKVFLSGGQDNPRELRYMLDDEISRLTNDKELQEMLIGRQYHTMVILGGCLYVIGGLQDTRLLLFQLGNNENAIEASVHVYSIRFNKWRPAGNLLTGVMEHASVSFQGKIYTFGGTTAKSGSLQGATNKVQIYSSQTEACVLGPEIPSAISKCTATVMEESIFVVGMEKEKMPEFNSKEQGESESSSVLENLVSDSNSNEDDNDCGSEEQDDQKELCEGNPVFYQFKPLDGVWIKLNPPTNITKSALCTFHGKIWNIVVGSSIKMYFYNPQSDMWESNSDDSEAPNISKNHDESEVVNYSVKCMQITHKGDMKALRQILSLDLF